MPAFKADAFFPGAWESVNYKGNVWGVPFNVDVWFFAFVNKALFKAAGIDPASAMTWEGLKAAAPKLTDASKGTYAIGLTGNKSEYPVVMTNSFIYSNGGAVLDAAGKCALTSPEAVDALEFYKEMTQYSPAGILNAANEQMRELFLNGTLADRAVAGARAADAARSRRSTGTCSPASRRKARTRSGPSAAGISSSMRPRRTRKRR